MDTAFVTTWKVPFPGREKNALEFATLAEEFWGKQAAEGRCTTPEWFFFSDGTGMWMVKGEREVLEDLVNTDEVRRLLVKGTLFMQDWKYGFAETGSAAERFIGDYAAELATI